MWCMLAKKKGSHGALHARQSWPTHVRASSAESIDGIDAHAKRRSESQVKSRFGLTVAVCM